MKTLLVVTVLVVLMAIAAVFYLRSKSAKALYRRGWSRVSKVLNTGVKDLATDLWDLRVRPNIRRRNAETRRLLGPSRAYTVILGRIARAAADQSQKGELRLLNAMRTADGVAMVVFRDRAGDLSVRERFSLHRVDLVQGPR